MYVKVQAGLTPASDCQEKKKKKKKKKEACSVPELGIRARRTPRHARHTSLGLYVMYAQAVQRVCPVESTAAGILQHELLHSAPIFRGYFCLLVCVVQIVCLFRLYGSDHNHCFGSFHGGGSCD